MHFFDSVIVYPMFMPPSIVKELSHMPFFFFLFLYFFGARGIPHPFIIFNIYFVFDRTKEIVHK